jgi:TatD DNase family protein
MSSTKNGDEECNSNPQLRLIDVDCNLWHPDLKELVSSVTPSTESSTETNESTHNSSVETSSTGSTAIPGFFRILQHDDIRNICAMVSPSSTVDEAVQGVAALQELHHAKFAEATTAIPTLPLSFPHILTTVGIHPYHVNDDRMGGEDAGSGVSVQQRIDHQMQMARELLKADRQREISTGSRWCCAIGECGLDGSEGFPPLTEQLPWFAAQLELAATQPGPQPPYPLFIHERLAFAETLESLSRYIEHDEIGESIPAAAAMIISSPASAVVPLTRPRIPILIHCFTGTVSECRTYLERGYSLSVSGHIFRNDAQGKNDVRQCLIDAMIPLDKLMIETDSPYMGFPQCRDLFVAHNADHVKTLKAKERKRLLSSQRPNPPSALTAVLHEVLRCLNEGRNERDEDLLTAQQLALCTSRNANAFFRFGIDDSELMC